MAGPGGVVRKIERRDLECAAVHLPNGEQGGHPRANQVTPSPVALFLARLIGVSCTIGTPDLLGIVSHEVSL